MGDETAVGSKVEVGDAVGTVLEVGEDSFSVEVISPKGDRSVVEVARAKKKAPAKSKSKAKGKKKAAKKK